MDISPKEIAAAIDDVPPLQKALIANGYTNVPVKRWVLEYSTASVHDDMISVTCTEHGELLPRIKFKLPFKDYPQFQVMKKGTPIYVSGKIQKVDDDAWSIALEDVRISFNEDESYTNDRSNGALGITIHANTIQNSGVIGYGDSKKNTIHTSSKSKFHSAFKINSSSGLVATVVGGLMVAFIAYHLGIN